MKGLMKAALPGKNGAQAIDLADLLKTKKRDEQAARVEDLIRMANAPVVDMVVRYDGRGRQVTGVTVIGSDRLTYDDARAILNGALEYIRRQELAEIKKAPAPKPTAEPSASVVNETT